MPVVIGDVCEVAARMEFRGLEDVVNVWRFFKSAGASADEADVLDDLAAVLETFYNVVKAILSARTVFRDITGRNVTQGVLLGTIGWPTLTVGTGDANDEVPGVAGLVSFPSPYPRVGGRKYIGGLTGSIMETDGTFSSYAVGVMGSAAAAILPAHVKTTGTYKYGVTRSSDGAFINLWDAIATDIPAYQRRRGQGRGS